MYCIITLVMGIIKTKNTGSEYNFHCSFLNLKGHIYCISCTVIFWLLLLVTFCVVMF